MSKLKIKSQVKETVEGLAGLASKVEAVAANCITNFNFIKNNTIDANASIVDLHERVSKLEAMQETVEENHY